MKTRGIYLQGLTIGIMLLVMTACQQKAKVKGQLQGMPAQTFRLEALALQGNVLVDSGKTAAEGQFEFSCKPKEETLYRLKFAMGKYILLALKKGDHAEIKGDWSMLENYTVEGSAGSKTLKGFLVNLRENIRDIRTVQLILDSAKANPGRDSIRRSAEDDLRNINTRFLSYVKKFADTTQSLSAALFAVNIINPKREGAYVTSFYKQVEKRFPGSATAKAFADRFLKHEGTAVVPGESNDRNMAPDFSAQTPGGDPIRLSSLRGKFVLLDFWASWCGPCRKENPEVVKAYQQFKDKNFTILGVSLDTDAAKWKAAIAADQLNWLQVSDLKGWQSTLARDYKVERIPQNFLIDPGGHIIARDLHGVALSEKLARVLTAN